MSTVNPPSLPSTGMNYQPRPIDDYQPTWSERFNWRIAVFVLVVALPILGLFGWWLNEFIGGGITDYGAYKKVDLKAMSSFDMDQVNATTQDIPNKWRELEGKQVLMIGEMWDPHSAGNDSRLAYFQLVYSKTKCCFSGPPLAQHFVDGYVVQGKHVYYYDVPVQVLGTLHVYIRKDPTTGVIKSIYHVEVQKVDPIEN
jgi:hypothetical protein